MDINIILALIVGLILVFLILYWIEKRKDEDFPDEELSNKIAEFRTAVMNDIANFIVNCYVSLAFETEDIKVDVYQTSYDNSILEITLPNGCIHTSEVNWKTNEVLLTSQFIQEAPNKKIVNCSSKFPLREGYVVDFTPIQEHLQDFNQKANILVSLTDLKLGSLGELVAEVQKVVASEDIQKLTDEEKGHFLFEGCATLMDMLNSQSEMMQNEDILQVFTAFFTYIELKHKEDFKKYLLNAITEEEEEK